MKELPLFRGFRAAATFSRARSLPPSGGSSFKQVLTVNEIFYSIQGESTRAGRPCVFVRLTACDLRCTWCDTAYAFHEGAKRTLDDVIAEVERFDCPLVEITGGEPLLQDEVYPLMERLLASGRTVMLETGGHRPINRVPREVIKIVDVKCPGSGEAGKNAWTNLDALAPHDEVKFVVKDRGEWMLADHLPARLQLQLHKFIWPPDTRGV
jgi:7-carboxy-7-deazaguanine synthase